MRKTLAVLALGAVALTAAVVLRGRHSDVTPAENEPAAPAGERAVRRPGCNEAASARPRRPADRSTTPVSRRASRAKEALVTLFSVRPGEVPPELPQLTFEERNLLPMIIENELTDADGCDAAAVRREFRQFMDLGGSHADFLPAYRRKLLKRLGK